MLSRVSRPTLPRWAPIALLLAVGWLGLVSIAAPATVRAAEINPRECLNWGQFGLWEGSFFFSTRPPRNDVIDRVNDHRPYLLPEADGRMLGSLKVPGEQILENDPGLISGDMELTPNTRIREYRSPQHATRFVLHDDGSFEYTPVPGYFGEDSFQYLWERTGWCSQPATVTINPLVGNIIANDHYVLDAIPLLPNGKIDRKSLPVPDTAVKLAGERVAPRNALERSIAEAMAQVLGVAEVGVDDDFFALGGHSLLAAQLTSRINKQLTEKTIELVLTPAAENALLEKGYDPTYGARQLRRTIQKHIEDPLAEAIVRGQLVDSARIEVDVEGGTFVFREAQPQAADAPLELAEH